MSKDIYIFDISRCDNVPAIFSIVQDAQADISLGLDEQEEIKLYGDRRMSQLNSAAAGLQKPRWP